MNAPDNEDLWRLYRREWVIVHTAYRTGNDVRNAFLAAQQWTRENLTGRVAETDIQFEAFSNQAGNFWVHVKVFKENLKGEFKYMHGAERHAVQEGYDEYTIVPRNSKIDHDIRSYGVKKL
jgi:hypothetical protein